MRIVVTWDADVTFTPDDLNTNMEGMSLNAGTRPFLVTGEAWTSAGGTGTTPST